MFSFLSFFNISASFILLVTGLAKIWSSFGPKGILVELDPVTGISFGWLLLLIGLIELLLSGICYYYRSRLLPCFLVGWLSLNFLLYRLALVSIGWRRPCSCLGNLTDAIHLAPELADTLMQYILAYLLIGSGIALYFFIYLKSSKK